MIDTSVTVASLEELLERLRAEEADYSGRLSSLRANIEHVRCTLALLSPQEDTGGGTQGYLDTVVARPLERAGRTQESAALGPNEWERKLAGLTQFAALLTIARENGGTVRSSVATRILHDAKKAHGSPRNTNKNVYHLLDSSDHFERIAPGTFRLTDQDGTRSDAENPPSNA